MKTTIYIDGYNLYYGALKGSSYKWLDIFRIFSHIANDNNPRTENVFIKFFTSPVISRLATHGDQSQKSQNDYHRALLRLYPDNLEIIMGYFSLSEGWFPKHQKPIDRNDTVKAWKLEEKKTDVNIALHIYRDLLKGNCEQAILVSNDSDLVPALEAVQEDLTDKYIGVVMPRIQKEGDQKNRPYNVKLSNLANWTRGYIREEELKMFQLPRLVPTKRKPIIRPDYW